MAERKWTASQWDAIKYSGKNLLVSAGAGSGKTATLTRRIIRLITDEGADISRMLIVTFTKSAASELRERITSALADALAKDPSNRHLSEQVCRVRGAMIHTMDAFFLSFVKPMFSAVGLPSDFRIADEGELAALRESAMEETCESFYEAGDGDGDAEFNLLAEAFGSARAEDALEGVFIKFAVELDSRNISETELYDYAARLEEMADRDPIHTPVYDAVFRYILGVLEYFNMAARYAVPVFAETDGLNPSYLEAALRLDEYTSHCLEAASDRDRLKELLISFPDISVRSTKKNTGQNDPVPTMFRSLRKEFSDTMDKIRSAYLSYTKEEADKVIRTTAKITHGAARLTERFNEIYGEAKRRRGVASFGDVARMAADLLCDRDGNLTDYGHSVCARYDYVFIDEYQDTSPIQDRIFSAVSKNSGRFMVGDIKQSIYAFRGGDPRAFAGYRSLWTDGGTGSVINMNDNFRCSPSVVDFTNAVSSHMFPFGDIDFDPSEDLLIHGREEAAGYEFSPVEVCLIEKPRAGGGREIDGEDTPAPAIPTPESKDVEAEYVAQRIRHILDHETHPDGRPIAPSDIAVMARTWTRRDAVEDALARHGIPVATGSTVSLTDRPEVLLLLCILRTVDNPTGDIPLAGMMRSAAFGFSLSDIAEIKQIFKSECSHGSLIDAVRHVSEGEGELSHRCRVFLHTLERYRVLAGTVGAAEFIYSLIRDPSVMCALEEEGGASSEHYVKKFYDFARGRDTSLFDFLAYIDKAAEEGLCVESVEAGSGVTFLTVHKSKGLEFPVCFLINAGSRYQTTAESRKSLIIDENIGPVMKLPDPSATVKCDSFLRRAALLKKEEEEVLEEMRILYVAMTRARDKLIVTSVVTDAEAELARAENSANLYCRHSVTSKRNHLSLILDAIERCGGDFAKIVTVPLSYILEPFDNTHNETVPKSEDTHTDISSICAEVAERLAFVYPQSHLKNIPSKLTVSRLYPEILDDIEEGTLLPGIEEAIEPSVPKFLRGSTYSPTDAGSAAHLFLQFCDFDRLHTLGVGAELCRLKDEGFMSETEATVCELSYIEAFRRSRLFADIRSAVQVHREFRFNAAVPAANLTADEERRVLFEGDDTRVIVQGVIDIVFETADGHLILADYKTDRLTDFELSHRDAAAKKLWRRHENQLSYYALVCSSLFGRKPDEVYIYSMPLGDVIRREESL